MCPVCLAQVSSPKPAYPKRDFNHRNTFRSESHVEDGVENTYVFLENSVIRFSESDKTSLTLMAAFQYEGKTLVKPKHIVLYFFNVAPKCVLPLHPDTTFSFDGVPLILPESFKYWRDRKPDEEGVGGGLGEMKRDGMCHEWTVMYISQKNFLRLVSSNAVEVHIGALTFKLTESNLEALRDLASRMVL